MTVRFVFSFLIFSIVLVLLAATLIGWRNLSGDLGTKSEPGMSNFENAGARTSSTTLNDWPCFRGPQCQASAENEGVPTQWSDTRNVLWKSKLPGRGASSPIVVGNKVLLTAFSGYGQSVSEPGNIKDLRHHLVCLDRDSGEIIWQHLVAGSISTRKINPELFHHGYASSTPVSDGNSVFAFFGASGLFAFDLAGNLQWQADVGYGNDYFGSSSSPIVYKNLVIVNASIQCQKVFALEKSTGAAVWKIDDINRCWSTPVVGLTAAGADELIINEENFVRGFNPQTGQPLWYSQGIEDYVVPVPVIDEGVCYCVAGRDKKFLAIQLGGTGDVTKTHRKFIRPGGANVPSPVVYRGHVYAVTDNGVLQCFDAASGETVFQHRTPTRKRVFASLTRIGNRLYLPTHDQGILVFQAEPKYKLIGQNEFQTETRPIMSSIAVSGQRLYVRDNQNLYCIARQNWPAKIVELPASAPSIQLATLPERHDVERQTGLPKRFVRYLNSDQAGISKLILMPYDTVITDSQRPEFNELISAHAGQYNQLKNQHSTIHWQRMTHQISQSDLNAQLTKIDTATMELTNQIRIEIKQRFTKQQYQQHMAEARARQEKLRLENQD